jgi:ATP-dependent Lon protease
MFLTTANSLRMPQPLMDRMEIIRIPGYTEDEKVEIAKRHLIPKEVRAHGLREGEWKITDAGMRDLIRYHTREAGVRNLEREIANLTRKAVKEIVSNKTKAVEVGTENLGTYAGVRKFRYGEVEGEDQVGVVTGLAWTEVGGETLQIESVMLPGKGRMQTTGKLGDVMKESIDAARSYVRSKATTFGIKPPTFDKVDIHVHVPEGATPKDGPSAGVGMATSIISVLTGIPVRRDVAMTGEVTLRGRVLPIGGLKEKLLAAHRGGITTVIIPEENKKDLAEIPKNITDALTIHPVRWIDQVLDIALEHPLTPLASQPDVATPEVSDLPVETTHEQADDNAAKRTH